MAINPLAPPVNYLGMLPQIDLAKQFEGLGEALVDRQKRTQTQEKQAAFTADFQNAKDNPTQENWLKMIATYPQYREAFTEVRKGFGEVETQKEFDAAFPISTAFDNGRPEIAFKLIVDLIAARKNAKMPTQIYEQILNEMELGNSKGAQAGVNYLLSNTNPERFEKFTKARIAAQSAPDVLAKTTAESKEAQGKADEAVSNAEIAALKAKGTPEELATEQAFNSAKAAKEELLRQQEAVKAKYAERTAVDKMIKDGVDLGLTKAQINEVLVKTSKLDLETKKAALELEAFKRTGGVDPAKIFEQEEKIRKEYQARTKVYGEVQTIFSNIQASAQAKTGPGDIALITGFMKMLDPGSVVRETEFATARDTAGLFESLKNDAQKLESGQLFALNSTQRQQYVNLAQQYLNASKKKADQDKKDLRVVVDNYKLNPDNVFGPQGGGRGDVNRIIPPQTAIDFLKKDPSRATEFEKKYGPGSAAQYLQAK